MSAPDLKRTFALLPGQSPAIRNRLSSALKSTQGASHVTFGPRSSRQLHQRTGCRFFIHLPGAANAPSQSEPEVAHATRTQCANRGLINENDRPNIERNDQAGFSRRPSDEPRAEFRILRLRCRYLLELRGQLPSVPVEDA